MFFLKKRSYLKDLIPAGYVDIHSHLLFGIDDGCKDADETVMLAGALVDIGFSEIITTPHTMQHVYANTPETIQDAYGLCLPILRDRNINIPFSAASEYMIDENFVTFYNNGTLLTLRDNHVLVEMSYLSAPIQLFNILFDLQIAGYTPILAHPERYTFYHHNYAQYRKLKTAGCLFQLNLLSVTGYYGKGVLNTASQLLNDGLIDFTGSDVHHKNHLAAFQNKVFVKDLSPLRNALENNSFFSVSKK